MASPQGSSGTVPRRLTGYRVGSVPYLNALPLTAGIESEILRLPPSQLAIELVGQQVDRGIHRLGGRLGVDVAAGGMQGGFGLVVELVEDFGQHVADVADVVTIVLAGNVGVRHGTHVGVQPVNGSVDVVQYPAAEEACNRYGDIEKNL